MGWQPNTKRSYGGIELGARIRKQLAKTYIFRVRRGNGYFGANLGEEYQDKYSYVVPTSITNTEGQTARDLLSSAVVNWQSTLGSDEKAEYNQRALEIGKLSGYNLYIREYIHANI